MVPGALGIMLRTAVLVGSGGGSLSVAEGPHGRPGLMVWTYEHAGKGMDDAHTHTEMYTYIDKCVNKYIDTYK